MGKNAGKPTRHTGGGGGGESYEDAWDKREFHSKAYQQQELQLLLNAPERLSWDEWKAQQQKKKEEEEAEFYGVGMNMMKYRQQLDSEREGRLKEREDKNSQKAERSGEKRSKKDKTKHSKKRSKSKGDKKRRKEGGHESSHGSSSDSDDDEAEHKSKKKHRKGKDADDQGPVKLSSFFKADADDADAL